MSNKSCKFGAIIFVSSGVIMKQVFVHTLPYLKNDSCDHKGISLLMSYNGLMIGLKPAIYTFVIYFPLHHASFNI